MPSLNELSTRPFGEILTNRIPDFIGLLVSFLVSALYWVGHLKLFRFVSEVNSKLLWLNIYFLLAIVVLPFSTAMFVNGFDRQGPFTFYCFNLPLIAILTLYCLDMSIDLKME